MWAFLGFIFLGSHCLAVSIHISTPTAMESLTENFANCFSTRPAEEEEIPVDEDPVINTSHEGLRNLVGKVVSQKIFSGHSLNLSQRS